MRKIAFKLCIPLLIASCGGPEGSAVSDEAGDDASAATNATTYYRLERDLRRCVSPLCGGYWVSSLNRTNTRCADGRYAARCYVAEADFSELGLSPTQLSDLLQAAGDGRVLAIGRLKAKTYSQFGNLGEFIATRAWTGATQLSPTGKFYSVADLGIVCITMPCFSARTTLLNVGTRTDVSGVDLSGVGATQEQLDAGYEALGKGNLLVAGTIQTGPSGPAGSGKTLTASQFYVPVGALACVSDTDCETSVYYRPVRSASDCYCRMCPQPVGAAQAVKYEAQWQRYCSGRRMMCPMVKCMAPGPVACTENKCTFAQ